MIASAGSRGDTGHGVPPVYNMVYVWTISLVAAMGGLLFGYDWVVIGGAKPFFEKTPNLQAFAQRPLHLQDHDTHNPQCFQGF